MTCILVLQKNAWQAYAVWTCMAGLYCLNMHGRPILSEHAWQAHTVWTCRTGLYCLNMHGSPILSEYAWQAYTVWTCMAWKDGMDIVNLKMQYCLMLWWFLFKPTTKESLLTHCQILYSQWHYHDVPFSIFSLYLMLLLHVLKHEQDLTTFDHPLTKLCN